ncbi:GNAT family N-acetyltransferase [Paenibacillaceae bacterium]|nr:GNAT family N-acetyltransferase [Paenibacillaceae bacterium]
MSKAEIRWAELNDCNDLGVVHLESYRAAYKGIIPEDFLNNIKLEDRVYYFENVLKTSAKKTALIAIENSIIGCAEIGQSVDDDLDASFVEIFAIYLVKEHSGKGFGKQLLEWVLSNMTERGYRNASLWVLKENINAIKFYENLDFVFDGSERAIERGKSLVQLRFRKAL